MVSHLAGSAAERPQCLVCGKRDGRRLYRLPRFSIWRCAYCTQVFIDPLPTEDDIRAMFDQLYRDGGGSVPELTDYYAACFDDGPGSPLVRIHTTWLAAIARHGHGGRLLDIGCGTGIFCHLARAYGWQPEGIDDAAQARAFARERYGLEVQPGNFEHLALPPDTYDLVTLWDVIEHSRAPRRLLEVSWGTLKPGGLIALGTPNQRNIMEVVAQPLYLLSGGRFTAPLEKFYLIEHFLYFTPATLGRLLEETGFEVLDMHQERTDLDRLTLHPVVRFGLRTLFLMARPLGLENRLFAIARKRG